MEIWIVIVLCIACLYAGYLIGALNPKRTPIDGTIIVDYLSGLDKGPSVYCSLPKSPGDFTGDEILKMNVYIAAPDILSSQQKQES